MFISRSQGPGACLHGPAAHPARHRGLRAALRPFAHRCPVRAGLPPLEGAALALVSLAPPAVLLIRHPTRPEPSSSIGPPLAHRTDISHPRWVHERGVPSHGVTSRRGATGGPGRAHGNPATGDRRGDLSRGRSGPLAQGHQPTGQIIRALLGRSRGPRFLHDRTRGAPPGGSDLSRHGPQGSDPGPGRPDDEGGQHGDNRSRSRVLEGHPVFHEAAMQAARSGASSPRRWMAGPYPSPASPSNSR